MRISGIKTGILAIILSVLLLSSCKNAFHVEDIRPTSFELESMSPNGLRSVNATVGVGISNPSVTFQVSEAEALVYHKGRLLGKVQLEPFEVKKKTDEVHSIDCTMTLADGINLFEVMALAAKFNVDDFTMDISGIVKAMNFKKKMTYTNVPASKFIRR